MIFASCFTITFAQIALARSIDLDSLTIEAGGRIIDRYLQQHSIATDSIRIGSTSGLIFPARFRTNLSSAKTLTIYDLRSELIQQHVSVDSMHTTLAAIFTASTGSRSEKILLESTEPVAAQENGDRSRYHLVSIRDAEPPSFWRSVAEPALVIIGAAAIVALFFLIRS